MPEIIELNIGPDKVHVIGDNLTIFAMRAMPDWTVREFSRVPIYFRGVKYFLKRKTPGPAPYAYHYELAPWASVLGQESTLSITYDETYVAEREQAHRSDKKSEMLHPGLLCIYPLLGFAWSGFKRRVLGPMGFEPAGITAASTLLGFCLFMVEGIFVFYFRGGLLAAFCGRDLFGAMLWVDRLLLALMPLDSAIRYSQVIRGDDEFDGLLEWAIRPIFKRGH